ncbi:ATP-binding protein [Phytomonospora sp. NPDC050363]|uniref:ATP-binding protein n=1 Tax=Phytomonospora sp. NPDC050363 TaxID=3155642 RepID=UPI0033DF1F5D
MRINDMRNPYDYGNAVSDPRLFAGRREELDRLGRVFDQAALDAPVGLLAVHGERAAGKTSLLNMAALMARDRGLLPVRVHLVPGDADPVGFFGKVYEELVGAAAKAGLTGEDGAPVTVRAVRRTMGGAVGDLPLEFPEAYALAAAGGRFSELALRTDLEWLASRLGRPVALFVDEAQLVAESDDVLSVLRALGAVLRGYVFVLAGTPDLLERVHRVFEHLLRQFEYVRVNRFQHSGEVLECISKPLTAVGIDVHLAFGHAEHEVAGDLFELSDGSPYGALLYCHAMFERWRAGAEEYMALTPALLDHTHQILTAGLAPGERPVLAKVRGLDDDELLSLNILGAGLHEVSADDAWFAHTVSGKAATTRERVFGHLSRFVADGLLEIRDGVVGFAGGMPERIYARSWSMRRLGLSPHDGHPVLGTRPLDQLLTANLERLLHGVCKELDAQVLPTCCPGMHPAQLDQGVAQFTGVSRSKPANIYAAYVHRAVVWSGYPAAVDITAVRCSYGGEERVRWIYSADTADVDLAADPGFAAVAAQAAELGGELTAERLRLPVRADFAAWVEATSTGDERDFMSDTHRNRSFKLYGAGDRRGALAEMEAAQRLTRSWSVLNTAAYLALSLGDHATAAVRADEAAELAETNDEAALSRYNAAIAILASGDVAGARRRLAEAVEYVERRPLVNDDMAYLFVPRLTGGGVLLSEKPDVRLGPALGAALAVVSAAEEDAAQASGSTP